MQLSPRLLVASTSCLVAALGTGVWLTNRHEVAFTRADSERPAHGSKGREVSTQPDELIAHFSDPNDPGTPLRVFVDPGLFEEDLFRVTAGYTGTVVDERSIDQRSQAIRGRVERALADLLERADELRLDSPPTHQQAIEAAELWKSIAYVYMYDGSLSEASTWLQKALDVCRAAEVSADVRGNLVALLGIIALRRGELDNCVACAGPSSCLFPISGDAVHQYPAGSREAIAHFLAYLEDWPGDLRVRWLLNVAYMTVGEYPDGVPKRHRILIEPFRSRIDVGRFTNVASLVGLTSRGPGLAGGAVFDDFNGDNLPDIFMSSIDADRGASLFLNRGDGTFADRSKQAGLDKQPYALNVRRGDFDNDGHLDVLLLRGGWELPARLSLLRNKGDGVFEDVTVSAGIDEPIATEAAEWGDFDNDGRLDLFVCGEYRPDAPDHRNLSRLYHNEGNGTFIDVAAQAGVRNDRYAKGAAWGDFDNDGRLDLFVSNMSSGLAMPSRLYHNEGDGTFRDVASKLGIKGANYHFTCLFWDYDNDGWLDLLVSDYHDSLAEVVAHSMGLPVSSARHPFLYRNIEGKAFRDVSAAVGLNRPIPAMSMNVGDIDNDGWLDLHLGTGWMSYSGLIPDLTLKNVEGLRFEDVSDSSGTGHLQKGHGVSFADWDCDGDLDLLTVYGGGYPGDKAYPALFQNRGHGRRHWLKIKAIGKQTNRSGLGCKIRAKLHGPGGHAHTIHRVVGNNGSFGGNSLVEFIGLADAKSVHELTLDWPTSGTTQTFRDVSGDQFIEVTEGDTTYRVISHTSLPVPMP